MGFREYLTRAGLHSPILGATAVATLGAATAIDPETVAQAYDTLTQISPDMIGAALQSLKPSLNSDFSHLDYFARGGIPGVLAATTSPITALFDPKTYQ